MHNLAGQRRAWRQAFDEIAVSAGWHETNILAVGFIGNRQAEPAGEGADLRLFHIAERKPQQLEVRLGRRVLEIALHAGNVMGQVEGAMARGFGPGRHVMAGRQDIGAEVLRRFKQIGEFDFAVASDARYGRLARRITLRERRDDLAPEPLLVVKDIVRDAEAGGGKTRIMNVLSGATGSFAVNRRAMVIKLQRHADNLVALLLEKSGHYRGVATTRHPDDHPRLRRGLIETETIGIFDPFRRRIFVHGRRPSLNQLACKCPFAAYRSDPVLRFEGMYLTSGVSARLSAAHPASQARNLGLLCRHELEPALHGILI